MKKLLIGIYRIARNIFNGTGISRIYPLNKIHLYLLRKLKAKRVVVNGYELEVDENDSLQLTVKGDYETLQTEFFKKYLKASDNILDIGANIGYYTILFSQLVGATGKVYAFEPDLNSYSILKRNIENNNCTNVALFGYALGDSRGKVKLYLNEENRGDNRILKNEGNQNWEAIEVEMFRADELIDSKTRIDFIKIDIQGAELFAFQGMENILNQNEKITIISEFWPKGMDDNGYSAQVFLDYFKSRNFKIYEMNAKKNKIIPFSNENYISNAKDEEFFTDLIITRNPDYYDIFR